MIRSLAPSPSLQVEPHLAKSWGDQGARWGTTPAQSLKWETLSVLSLVLEFLRKPFMFGWFSPGLVYLERAQASNQVREQESPRN